MLPLINSIPRTSTVIVELVASWQAGRWQVGRWQVARGSSWHAWVLGRGVTSAVQLEERQRGAGAAQRRRGAIGSPPHRNWRIGQLLIHGFVRFALLGPGPLCYMLETKCDVLLDLLHSIKSMPA